MKNRFDFILFLIVVLAGSTSKAAVLAGPVFNPSNGNSYYLLEEASWTDSQTEAVSLGGNLVTINDAAENSWVYNTFSTLGGVRRHLWIGLVDTDQAINSASRATRRGEFSWVSGEPVGYTNWSSFEPNNPISNDPLPTPEFFGHIWSPTDPSASRWNNYRDLPTLFNEPLNGVVEVIIPEPSTITMITLLGLLLLRRQRLSHL